VLTYQEALVKAGGNLSLEEYKRLYQKQCREDVRAGVASKESMQLFSHEATKQTEVQYKDVDYD